MEGIFGRICRGSIDEDDLKGLIEEYCHQTNGSFRGKVSVFFTEGGCTDELSVQVGNPGNESQKMVSAVTMEL